MTTDRIARLLDQEADFARRRSEHLPQSFSANGSIGYGAYYADGREYPNRYIILRHRNSVVSRSNPRSVKRCIAGIVGSSGAPMQGKNRISRSNVAPAETEELPYRVELWHDGAGDAVERVPRPRSQCPACPRHL